MPTGGQVLVKSLKKHGVDTVFCVAGESYLPVLDALLDYPDIQVVTCRQESGATFAAEAYAHLTGKVGIAMVTRGPGACNGSIGVHTGKQSSAPMIMFVGQINSKDKGKEAFQEFDLPAMFSSHSKWAADIPRVEAVAEYVSRAFLEARAGRMGPVVLGLPEEVLKNEIMEPVIAVQDVPVHIPDIDAMGELIGALKAAQRPLVILGGSDWQGINGDLLAEFVASATIPLADSLRRQGVLDRADVHYIGDIGLGPNPALVQRIKQADVVLLLGSRLSESMTQDYTLFGDEQTLLHIHPSEAEFNKVYQTDINVRAHMGPALEALIAAQIDGSGRAEWTAAGRADYEAWISMPDARTSDWNGADMTQIFRQLRALLPRDAILTGDAGNFAGWVRRYLQFNLDGKYLAPVSGAMGYCVPSAVAASLNCPDRVVLGFCGDGGFMMSSQEFATAMHHGAKPIIMVCNNSIYGTIRMHQEKDFPGRVSATDLTNPDFVKLAESYGAFGVRVTHEDEFEAAWQAALAADTIALIEIQMDPRQITPNAKL
jgi:acetolactate synthase-1/2/3 large subunit